jgi:acyl dehydratase
VRTFTDLAELEAAVGTEIGTTDWLEITQERVDAFADATDDHQWIHVDPARAATGPFGGTIAHGYLTLSLIPALVSTIYTVEGLRMAINYGSNKVRFPSPVPVDSRVRAGAELMELRRTDHGAQATLRVTVERQGGDKPACVAETVSLLVP